MNPSAVHGVLAVAALSASLAFAQGGPAPKTFGSVFKREVDGTINALCAAIRTDGSLGDGSALQTAQVLTAMGYSHRFYTLGDGPAVRRPVNFLFAQRNADGGFGDSLADESTTTLWVRDALAVLEPDEHKSEIDAIDTWIAAKGVRRTSPWEQLRIETASRGGNPIEIGSAAAESLARGPVQAGDGSIDFAATIDALTTLVACQAFARDLDRGTAQPVGFSDVAQRGFDYLLTRQKDGVFFVSTPGGDFPDIGLSGLGLAALQTKPVGLRTEAEQALIAQGIEKLVAAQNEDGSFGQTTVNYATCAAVLALAMANDPQLEKPLVKARNYILAIQNIEDRGYARGDRDYGSIGYGGDQRGDLSNLGFAIDALRKTGLDEQHEAFAKALVFLQRTQNLRSVNDFGGRRVKDENGEWQNVEPGNDGGSAYYPGNSPAGYDSTERGTKVPRSYGSMTYMLLRTYTLCGIDRDDARVAKAIEWISKNWTLDENPGSSPLLPEKTKFQGLFYYYMVLAQALDNAGIDTLVTTAADGSERAVDWRAELEQAIGERQRDDGSWVNDKNGRWWESQPIVCTIYAMLALERCER